MSEDDRKKLGRQQEAVLRALVAGGEVPRGMADAELAGARKTLMGKRGREVELAGRELKEALGERFRELFEKYARECGYPEKGGPGADVAGLGRWLEKRGELPLAAGREAVVLRLRYGFFVQWVKVTGKKFLGIRIGGRVWVW